MPDSPSILFLPGDRSNKTLLGCIVRSKKITQQNGKEKKKLEEFFSRVFTQGGKGRRRKKAFFDLASFDEEMSLAAPPRITFERKIARR